ncbi:hypothetical protein ACFLUA_02560 [Chloroflexota bacterium]
MNSRPERPLSVTLYTWLVLIISVSSIVRTFRAALQWEFLTGLLPIHPIYLLLSGLVWGIFGLILIWGLWRGLTWTPFVTRWAVIAYFIYYWADRIFLSNPVSRITNIVFMVILTVIILSWTLWVFSRVNVKQFFGETHE